MRFLLAGLVLFLLAAEVFSWDISLATGFSAKNGILYLIATFLMFRMAVLRDVHLDAQPVHACFVLLIAYAIVTWLIAGLIVEYPGYDLLDSAIRLKSGLLDHFIFFLVFFHGTRTAHDAVAVARALLLAAVFANAMTVADVAGVIDLGFEERADGRAQGALGESNQYAAFISLFLPGTIAAALLARKAGRAFWLGAVLISAVALIMTVSRGAFVGLLVAGVWGAWLYRQRLSLGRVTAWLAAIAAIATLALSVFQYAELLQERLFAQTGSIDLSDASSGRIEIWTGALAHMLVAPITLLTGFGWDVYWSMPFRYSPHNHYLGLWFNLGLPGLACGTLALASAVYRARRASEIAAPELRPHLIGFAIGALAVCVAVFFVDLHLPWLYFWAYAGLMMRVATSVRSDAAAQAVVSPESPEQSRGPLPAAARDAHGWVARPRSLSTSRT
jgi:O-antigen ligase